MARGRSVSDFSNKTIDDEKQSATITIKYGDGRAIIVADAHIDDAIVRTRKLVASRLAAPSAERLTRSHAEGVGRRGNVAITGLAGFHRVD